MSSQIPVISASKLDISKISVTKPKKNKDGKLVSYLNFGETGFMIETPTMHSFGVGKFKDDKKGIDGKYNLTCTQRASGGETEEAVNHFFEFLKGLDEKMIDFLIEHSQTFFGETYTKEDRKLVSNAYKKYRIVKEKNNKTTNEPYPPSFKVSFQTIGDEKKGEEVTPVIQLLKGKTPVEINSFDELVEHVPKNSAVRVVIQPRVYVLNDIAGIKFTARFMKVPEVKRMNLPTSFTFTDDSEGDNNNQTNVEEEEVVDSEEGEEVVEEEEEEVEEEEE